MTDVTPVVAVVAESAQTVVEIARNLTYLDRARQLAQAHPVGAAVVGVAVAGLAAYGTYKLADALHRKYRNRNTAI